MARGGEAGVHLTQQPALLAGAAVGAEPGAEAREVALACSGSSNMVFMRQQVWCGSAARGDLVMQGDKADNQNDEITKPDLGRCRRSAGGHACRWLGTRCR